MAYEFNGSNQYISATAPLSLSGSNITLVGRVLSVSLSGQQKIVHVYESVADQFATLGLRGDISGDPADFAIRGTGGYNQSKTSSEYSTNTWYQVSGVSSSNVPTVYLNGVAATAAGNAGTRSNNTLLYIGSALSLGSVIAYLNGKLAEVAAWSVALTAAEIASLSKGFKAYRIRPQSLVFYIPFVRNLQDLRAGLALTNNNTATVAAHPRVY